VEKPLEKTLPVLLWEARQEEEEPGWGVERQLVGKLAEAPRVVVGLEARQEVSPEEEERNTTMIWWLWRSWTTLHRIRRHKRASPGL
jgi:hypothetical protein